MPQRKDFIKLLWACGTFLAVYVIIHILLNLAAQETAASQGSANDGRSQLTQLAGPITISLCSSLLIFSYGVFILRGLTHLSVSAPRVFFYSFLIFVYGQIAVQISGHTEIYLYSQTRVAWPLALLSTLSYPCAFLALFLLESYAARAFSAVRDQIPKSELPHASDATLMAWLTLASVLLLAFKFAAILFDKDSTPGVVITVLLAEGALAIVVVLRAISHNFHVKEGTPI